MSNAAATPLVSVCIQTFQHAAYIRQCLDSVLKQRTDFPFEIILGDDDSTDGTREICQQYADAHPSVIKFFPRNSSDKIFIDGKMTGRFNFINNLKAARGKYIALLDGDDFWTDEHKLELQVGFLEHHPDYILCFHRHRVLQENRTKRIVYFIPRKKNYSLYDLARKTFLQTSTAVFRNPGFETVPDWFWKTPVLDIPLFFHLAAMGKMRFLNRTMSVYRHHAEGAWSRLDFAQKQTSSIKLLDILMEHYDEKVKAILQSRRKRHLSRLLEYYKKTNAVESYNKALKLANEQWAGQL